MLRSVRVFNIVNVEYKRPGQGPLENRQSISFMNHMNDSIQHPTRVKDYCDLMKTKKELNPTPYSQTVNVQDA